MSAIELDIFLVAIRDEWVGLKILDEKLPGSMVCFGSVEEARKYIASCAKQMNRPACAFRIARYKFSGDVLEG